MDIDLTKVATSLLKGESAVLSVILAQHGSSPRGAGATMVLNADGSFEGTVGGGAVEYRSQQLSQSALQEKKSFTENFNLSARDSAQLGMVCGGAVRILFAYLDAEDPGLQKEFAKFTGENGARTGWIAFTLSAKGQLTVRVFTDKAEAEKGPLESLLQDKPVLQEAGEDLLFVLPITSPGRVYVFGGGHVAQHLVPMLHKLNFSCVLIDDREEFANQRIFPQAEGIMMTEFKDVFERMQVGPSDYLAIMTRGHLSDFDVLVQALHSEARYIGMIGSRSKIKHTYKRLNEEYGFTEKDTDRIHSPIGLHIGGETPEEVALSIAAELVGVRSGVLK